MGLPVAWTRWVPLAHLRNTGKRLIPFAFSRPDVFASRWNRSESCKSSHVSMLHRRQAYQMTSVLTIGTMVQKLIIGCGVPLLSFCKNQSGSELQVKTDSWVWGLFFPQNREHIQRPLWPQHPQAAERALLCSYSALHETKLWMLLLAFQLPVVPYIGLVNRSDQASAKLTFHGFHWVSMLGFVIQWLQLPQREFLFILESNIQCHSDSETCLRDMSVPVNKSGSVACAHILVLAYCWECKCLVVVEIWQ